MMQSLNCYATTNGLQINIDKTKIIFNKTGRLIRKTFYLGETKINTAKEYKYLGFKITPHGGVNPGLLKDLKDLKDRAMKAFYKMKHQMGPTFRKDPLITIKLFQTLIQPILLYASDFWGILKQSRNNPIEVMHMKFCKELLGVQKQTTNVGVLLELGQIPLSIRGIKSAIKNWVRICSDQKCNNLLKLSYENRITHHLTWKERIEHTLTVNGMHDIFLNKNKNAHLCAFQRLYDIFHQSAFHDMKRDTSKLRTYNLLKAEPGYEMYLSEIQNINQRIALTKFRLSNHCLKIETGRHERIDKNNRFCPFCPNLIENEKHALLECKTYQTLRKSLFESLDIHLDPSFPLSIETKFIKLLKDPEYQPLTAKYLCKMFHCREFLLKHHRNTT